MYVLACRFLACCPLFHIIHGLVQLLSMHLMVTPVDSKILQSRVFLTISTNYPCRVSFQVIHLTSARIDHRLHEEGMPKYCKPDPAQASTSLRLRPSQPWLIRPLCFTGSSSLLSFKVNATHGMRDSVNLASMNVDHQEPMQHPSKTCGFPASLCANK